MTVTRQTKLVFLFFLASAWFLGTTGFAQAQTETTARYTEVHYPTEQHVYPVGNPANGHVYGVWVRKGLTMFADGEVATYSALGDLGLRHDEVRRWFHLVDEIQGPVLDRPEGTVGDSAPGPIHQRNRTLRGDRRNPPLYVQTDRQEPGIQGACRN